ncbi:hypothetical protein [Bacillus taeanensis]|uniref:hypothetical protein n=1 Tax=Bacillus taeanensis TaxID=273032 RepID=UPI0015F0F226|nr:hypothetical protein [Bacillus taeanensis]
MSHIVRDYKVEFLRNHTTITIDKIMKMTDVEVEYYHWLYAEDENSDSDYVHVH